MPNRIPNETLPTAHELTETISLDRNWNGPCHSAFRKARTGTFLVWLLTGWLLALPSFVLADKADDDFSLAVGLYRNQRWQLAAQTLQQFITEFPEHPRNNIARLYYALSLSSLEDYAAARTELLRFIAASPESRNLADARYRLGECSFYLRDYPSAVTQLSEYLQEHPNHELTPWATLMLSNSWNAAGQSQKAEQKMKQLLSGKIPEQLIPEARLVLAKSLHGQGRLNDAVSVYQQVAQTGTESLSAEAMFRIGMIRFDQGEFNKAIEDFEFVRKNHSASVYADRAVFQLAVSHFRLKEFTEALTQLETLKESERFRAERLLLQGICQRELGEKGASYQSLEKAYALSDGTSLAPEILFKRAQFEQLDDRKETAARMFLDLADRWPDHHQTPDSLYLAAEIWMELGDTTAADRAIERLLSDFPDATQQARVMILKGRSLLSRQESEEAIEVLRKAVAEGRQNPDLQLAAQYHLVRALNRHGQHQEVIDLVDQIKDQLVETKQQDFRAALVVGSISGIELGNYPLAEQLAAEYLATTPTGSKVTDAIAAHAVAVSHQNRPGEAESDLQSLLKTHSENPQTWMAILQCAEAFWQQSNFAVAGRFFELASSDAAEVQTKNAGLSGAGWCYFRLNEFRKAKDLFQKIGEVDPTNVTTTEAAYMSAMCTLELGDKDEAIKEFEAVYTSLTAQTEPHQATLKYLLNSARTLARILEEQHRTEDANRVWEGMTRQKGLETEAPLILQEWAQLNVRAENFESADSIYRRLLEQYPESPLSGTARLFLAESAMQANKLKDAQTEFLAIAAEPGYGDSEREIALYHAIDISASDRDWQSVRKLSDQFTLAFSTSPYAPQVQLLNAEALLDQGQYQLASQQLELLRDAVIDKKLTDQDWTQRIWVVSAELALAAKRYSEIDAIAEDLRQTFSESRFEFQILYVQGRRWKQQSPPDFERSRDYFTRVINDESGKGTETAATSQFMIAETYLLQNDYEKAVKEYYRVYVTYPQSDWRARGLYQAAGCEVKLGHVESAVRSYSDLLKEFPTSELASQAKTRLHELTAKTES
ncbi:MAG: tetratricopeptide repeat protein [Planctomycetaceae bacterium]|nr:tetratricopeptide repeat protein [Planctomycetaceae bacterium]